MKKDRSSGILMPIFSLPSNYGIGSFGKEAYKFVDFLEKAGQKYWQILPIGPTGYGDSPYQSFSSYAGNPYFIDLDILCEEGSIFYEDLKDIVTFDEEKIDYGYIYSYRFDILKKAFLNSKDELQERIREFDEKNAWLDDYALYMSLKAKFGMKSFLDWEDEDIKLGKAEAKNRYREELKDDIAFYKYMQYKFFEQWGRLKEYANNKGIKIMGDLPIYVSMDSADCWSNPEVFMLDEKNVPTFIAGVPPDYFSEDGQLWGNPLYNWDKLKETGYKWWLDRVRGSKTLYDSIRIDHFRGFEKFWAVEYGKETAKIGTWMEGPGMDFVSKLKEEFPEVYFVAEDLGETSPGLEKLLSDSGFPGMKILQFAFNPYDQSIYLPHNFTENYVAYTGTHDNTTIMDWARSISKEELDFACNYLGISDASNINKAMIRCGMASISKLFVFLLQDYLGMGKEARINSPGVAAGNWQWRLKKDVLTDELANEISYLTYTYGRRNN